MVHKTIAIDSLYETLLRAKKTCSLLAFTKL
jgi:hypothetical protein